MIGINKLGAIAVGCSVLALPALAAEVNLPDPASLVGKIPAVAMQKSAKYIVMMADNPVAGYEGGIKGLRATKPKKNQKLNPKDPAVIAYADYLAGEHDKAMKAVGAAKKLYSYKYAFNGFAAELTAAQLQALKALPGVASVVPAVMQKHDTITTSDYLELETGLWNELTGVDVAGEGIVVGIIDSGIWPENPSFSDRNGTNKNGKSGKLNFQQIPGWHGKCTPGEDFPASDCNQKLIGAQWFNEGFGGDAGVKAAFPYEFASARDADGHGSHTAATAAGNSDVEVVINGSVVGTASGMAPRARIAAYKVCWGAFGEGGCSSIDSVAAIDQAVIDGVDVLNYSISGSLTSFLDPVEVAFLFAADAGVFVAASAGNSGPDASTVAHNSPWLSTVAAGTHDRGYEASVSADGEDYDGVSLGAGTDLLPLVYSSDVGLPGADPAEATLCYPGTLDSALVAGKIVLCDRGEIARVDKSLAVAQADGAGMILANTSPNSLNADFHSVPSIHVDEVAGTALRDYAKTEGAKAQISAGVLVEAEASQVAGFSSRGPALAGGGDLLKPDIMAPGVDIIAAVSPVGYDGESFGALSGTSMSSPHIAGLGALMKQLHPDWSPAMIKSAFMTSATQMTNKGNPIEGGALDYGAGAVQPNSAANPGLVYDAGFNDWLGFLCGTGELQAFYCPAIGIDPSNLNYPSIASSALVFSESISRTVTNVGDSQTYEATAVVDGFDVVVSPDTLNLSSGESASYTVTFTNAGAPLKQWAEGEVVWTGNDGIVIRSPVVLRPSEIDVAGEVAYEGENGSDSLPVKFGFDGDFTSAAVGLEPALMIGGNVVDDPANDINEALVTGVGLTFEAVVVPDGAAMTRFALFDDYTDGGDDLDLYVFGPASAGFPFVGSSGSSTSEEQVDLANPSPGLYFVAVHGWQTDGDDANYSLFAWSPVADAGNLTVSAPATVTAGEEGTISIDWTDLADGMKYLGVLLHESEGSEVERTIVTVTTD